MMEVGGVGIEVDGYVWTTLAEIDEGGGISGRTRTAVTFIVIGTHYQPKHRRSEYTCVLKKE